MRFTWSMSIFTIWMILFPGAVPAQTVIGDVTFEVPINLTRMWGEITKVAVWCTISSDTLIGTRTKKLSAQLELPVSAGQLVTTARVVVPVSTTAFMDPKMVITNEPTGKPASYQCSLSGFSTLPTNNGGGWKQFSADSANPAFRLTPTPPSITGNFVW